MCAQGRKVDLVERLRVCRLSEAYSSDNKIIEEEEEEEHADDSNSNSNSASVASAVSITRQRVASTALSCFPPIRVGVPGAHMPATVADLRSHAADTNSTAHANVSESPTGE